MAEDMKKLLEDYGMKPLELALTEDERKLASMGMGVNAALVQFVLEGIIPPEHQMHFMRHLMEFTGMLYAGEKISFPGSPQTMAIDTEAGKLYAVAAAQMLTHGRENAAQLNEAIKKALAERQEVEQDNDDGQTNNLEGDASVKKPTLH